MSGMTPAATRNMRSETPLTGLSAASEMNDKGVCAILMGDDPLGAEFAEMKAQFCPGFNAAASTAKASATTSVQG